MNKSILRKHIRAVISENVEWGIEQARQMSFPNLIRLIKKNKNTDDARFEEQIAQVLHDYFSAVSIESFLKSVSDPDVYSIFMDAYNSLSKKDYNYIFNQVSVNPANSAFQVPKVGQKIYVAVFPINEEEKLYDMARKITGIKQLQPNTTVRGKFKLRSVNKGNIKDISPIFVYNLENLGSYLTYSSGIVCEHIVTKEDIFTKTDYASMQGAEYELEVESDYIDVESVHIVDVGRIEDNESAK